MMGTLWRWFARWDKTPPPPPPVYLPSAADKMMLNSRLSMVEWELKMLQRAKGHDQ